MKTWKSRRTVVRSSKTGHFARKGWGKAYKKQRVRVAMPTLFHVHGY